MFSQKIFSLFNLSVLFSIKFGSVKKTTHARKCRSQIMSRLTFFLSHRFYKQILKPNASIIFGSGVVRIKIQNSCHGGFCRYGIEIWRKKTACNVMCFTYGKDTECDGQTDGRPQGDSNNSIIIPFLCSRAKTIAGIVYILYIIQVYKKKSH